MSFITPEKVREIRLRGAKDLEIDGLDTKFKLVKLSAKAGEQLIELQEQVKAGKISPVAVAGFTLQHAVATPEGDLLSHEDADQLMSVLSLEAVMKLSAAFTDSIDVQMVAGGAKKGRAAKKA
jgi:predicted polyphosphate/ATP-dependent NAD kinase